MTVSRQKNRHASSCSTQFNSRGLSLLQKKTSALLYVKRHSISVRAFHGESLAGLSSRILQRAQLTTLPEPVRRRIRSEQSEEWRERREWGGDSRGCLDLIHKHGESDKRSTALRGWAWPRWDLAMWWAWFPCWQVCLHSWRPALCFYWEARRVWALSPPRHAMMALGT